VNYKIIVCPECESNIRDAYFCSECGKHLKRRPRRESVKQDEDFIRSFDSRCLEVAIHALNQCVGLLVTQLIARMVATHQEGFKFMPRDLNNMTRRQKSWWRWARRRVIFLAKMWHRQKKAFIGTKTVIGHPYYIYLPGKPPPDVVPVDEVVSLDEITGR